MLRSTVVVLVTAGSLIRVATGSDTGSSSQGSLQPSTTMIEVKRCPTTFAVPTHSPVGVLPAREQTALPRRIAEQLELYVGAEKLLMTLAPRGWDCIASIATDGSGGLVAYPHGERVPVSEFGAGWTLPHSSATSAVTVLDTGASPVQAAAQACRFFVSAAKSTLRDLGQRCVARPADHARTLSADAVAFEDPAGESGSGIPSGGRNRARAVITYSPSSTPGSYLSTCTIPAAQADLCSALLQEFVGFYAKQ